jgi:hypothetical protein
MLVTVAAAAAAASGSSSSSRRTSVIQYTSLESDLEAISSNSSDFSEPQSPALEGQLFFLFISFRRPYFKSPL